MPSAARRLRLSACASRAVHLEPARGAAAEAQGAAVVARAEKDDLPGAAAEAAGDLGVDDLRALRQCGAAADGDAHRAGDGAVEAALGLDVTAGGRRARALQAESLRRGEAGRQGGMAGAAQGTDGVAGREGRRRAEGGRGAQVGIALAVAVRGWPKRSDR